MGLLVGDMSDREPGAAAPTLGMRLCFFFQHNRFSLSLSLSLLLHLSLLAPTYIYDYDN